MLHANRFCLVFCWQMSECPNHQGVSRAKVCPSAIDKWPLPAASPQSSRSFGSLTCTGYLMAADVPLHPARHQGPPIKTPSGPRWSPDELMPRMHHVGAVQSHLPRPHVCHFTLPSASVVKPYYFFLGRGGLVLTNQLSKRWVSTPGWLWMNWMRDIGRRWCKHVNKSISGAVDGWDL